MKTRIPALLTCLVVLSVASACVQVPPPIQSPAPTASQSLQTEAPGPTATVAPAPTTAPSATPEPIPTAEPTAQPSATEEPAMTPQSPETPVAALTPPAGWKRLEAEGMELWVPESYEGGDLSSEDAEVIVAGVRRLGPEFEQFAQLIEQNPSLYPFFAFDSEIGSSGSMTNIIVAREKVLSAITIDTYLDAVSGQLPGEFEVVEREIVPLGANDAGRLVLSYKVAGVEGNQLIYVIQVGNTMWVITFSTGAGEFEQRLPEFEQSARTFATRP